MVEVLATTKVAIRAAWREDYLPTLPRILMTFLGPMAYVLYYASVDGRDGSLDRQNRNSPTIRVAMSAWMVGRVFALELCEFVF
jgi:hypothetical protein